MMSGKKSLFIDHFQVLENVSGATKARCKHCPSVISGTGKTTSNFVTHLKRKHRDVYLETSAKSSLVSTLSQPQQPAITSFIPTTTKYAANDPRQLRITDSLIMFIAGDLLPLSVVESQNFIKFMETVDPRYQLPSRKTLSSKLLPDKSSAIQSNLRQLLQQASSISLTVDLWTNRQMSGFLGITGHCIVNWEMQSIMIACKHVKGSHTAEFIREQYEEAIACYQISDKIKCVITDNAANITKAFNSPLPGYECLSSDLEKYSDQNSDTDSNSEEDDHGMSCEEAFHSLPKHSPCYAHTLQLVVKDGLKEAGYLKKVIGKSANIVSHVRRSTHASDLLEGEKRLQPANQTRWNSQLTMIKSVLQVPAEKLNQLDTISLTAYDRKLLQELCDILGPFKHATDMIQQEKHVTASMTIPVTRGLKHQLKQILSIYDNKMTKTLEESIVKRLSHYEDNDIFLTASVLDPRFKLRWCETEEERMKIKSSLITKVSKLAPNKPQQSQASSDTPPRKSAKLDIDFFSFMESSPDHVRLQTSAETEVEDYLGQPCVSMSSDPLHFWREQESNLPSLNRLATSYLAVPASSAPVERLFSIAGKVFRPDRCQLSDSTFQTLMMIRCNAKLPSV